MEGQEPTLKTHAMQRELEALAKNGIELELQEVEQTAANSGDKNSGSDVLLSSSVSTKRMEAIMTTPDTTTTTNPTQAMPTPGVNDTNFGIHTEARLRDIAEQLKEQNSPGTAAKNAAVMAGAVVVGSLAAQGLWKLGAWILAPSPTVQ